jgi:subtilisin-like proprotein convertase family protein
MRLNSLYVAMIATCAGTAFAVPNPEVEPNDTKAAATPANSGGAGMAAGDTIEGATTGTATTNLSLLTSADYYRVKTAAAPLGIYRHRLSLTNTQGVNAYAATIRGLSQTGTAAAGGTAGTTDATFQTAQSSTTTPARFVQWYGFGKQEEIYYRVNGGTTTTGTYTATLIDDAVTPIVVAQPIQPGLVTLGNATTNTTDTSWVLYDANFNAITNAEDSGLTGQTLAATRAVTLTPGTYTVAYSNYRTTSNQVTPAGPGETFWGGGLLDFPNAVANSSTTVLATLNFRITDAAGTTAVAAPKPGAFDVQFIQFTVAAVQTNPAGTVTVAPGTVINDGTGSAVVTAAVNPGQNPTSTGLTVSLDASLVGGGTVALLDDGVAPDAAAGDNIFTGRVTVASGTAVGSFTLPVTITDAEARTGTTTATLATREPIGACCVGSTASVLTLSACTSAGGTFRGDGSSPIGSGTLYTSTDAFPIAIPDYVGPTPGSASSTVTISSPATISSLSVRIGLTHTFVGDLIGTLSNGTTSVILFTRTGAGTDLAGVYNFNDLAANAFGSGVVTPLPAGDYKTAGTGAGLLSAFAGSPAAGTWTLTVTDNAGIDTGSITAFAVDVNPTPCPSAPACLADISGGGPNGDEPDGTVDGSDFIAFINSFGLGDATVDAKADIVDGGGVPPGDGTIDGSDFIAFINAFGAGC